MKTLKLLFLAALIGSPFIAGAAAPTVKVTTPTKSSTTNGVLNASGTAKSSAAITGVFYSLNNGGFVSATGTTNWTVANLLLTPGTNIFSVYATDATAAVSKTNTVKFIYAVDVPISITIVGNGTVTPVTNGELLQIEKAYKLSAKPAKGFGFVGWTGGANTNSEKVTVLMASNLAVTATFKDTSRPICIVTFPAVKHSVSNSPITVTGRASDNVGVIAVNYQLNNGGWNAAAMDVDGTNWTAADLALTPGANTIQAFATDAAGNISLTNSVQFTDVSNAPPPVVGPAPAPVSGLEAEIMLNGDTGPFHITFGDNTFALDSTNGNEDSGVGNYSYSLSSSNTAQLTLSNVLPPQNPASGDQLVITFTNDSGATFTDTNGNNGSLTLTDAANLAPSAGAIISAQYVGMSGTTNIIKFGGGMFTNTDGMTFTNWGACTIEKFSPQDAMLTEYFMDDILSPDVGYVQLDFSAAGTGDFFFNLFDNLGNLQNNDSGTFAVLTSASQPAGFAPDSLAGLIWNVTPAGGGTPFQFCFGATTYSRTSSDTNKDEVGDYTFTKTGANTAQFADFEVAPLLGGNGGNRGNGSDLVFFTYSSANNATFVTTNYDNGDTNIQKGSVKVSLAKNLAPGSLAGKTVIAKFTGFSGTVTLNDDGTGTITSSTGLTNDSGVYTYSPFSPIGGMLVFYTTASTTGDLGKVTYNELTFSSPGVGTIFSATFNSSGNLDNSHNGTFVVH